MALENTCYISMNPHNNAWELVRGIPNIYSLLYLIYLKGYISNGSVNYLF